MQGRVAGVQESVELGSSAARQELEADLEGPGDLAKHGQRHVGDLPGLDPRHHRL